jgi:UTP--glucose-1-phosphate uridylyltransferase
MSSSPGETRTMDSVLKALIPAAGRGTRFLPFTKAVPKELVPLVSTPALEFVVAEAADHGVTDVLLVVSPDKSAISEYFAPNVELEAALEAKGDEAALASIRRASKLAAIHQVEQLQPRGLGDAVAHGERFAAGEPVASGRCMFEVFAEHGGIVLGLIDVAREDISKYGIVSLAEGSKPSDEVVAIADLVEKPTPEQAPSTLAIIGRYVLPAEIFGALRTIAPGAGGEVQLTDAMRTLAHDGVPVHGVVFRGRRYDTGDRLGYVKAVVQLAVRHPEIGDDFTSWLRKYVSTEA